MVFILEVPASAFSSKGEIRVSVWDSTQIKLSMSNEGCVASIDASGKEETTCPPGVTYQKPSPEVFTFSHADLARPLTIPSKSVTVGEPYRVFIGGKASDDCNSVSARVDNVALEETVSIKDLALAQTEMACLPPQ